MRQKRPSITKQKHEVRKYLRQLETELYAFALQTKAIVSPLTVNISNDGTGGVYLPSRSAFEKIDPQSQPIGLVFADESFLVFQEIVRFGYQDESATEPVVYRLKYSYHYQRPTDHFFFRYDHHPEIGHLDTHPLHHLHCAGWLPNATQFQSAPRFEVNEIKLGQVLRLILISFPTIIPSNIGAIP